MATVFYGSIFVTSLLCSAIYILIRHKHFDVNLTLIFTLVPIACMSYFLRALAVNIEEIILSLKVTYIGGCFLPLFMLFIVLDLCRIRIRKWQSVSLFLTSVLTYCFILTIGFSDIYYKTYRLVRAGGEPVVIKEYGPMHVLFYVVLVFYLLGAIFAIAYSWFKKREAPRTILMLLLIPEVISVASYFGGKTSAVSVDLVPLGYVLAQITYLFIANRLSLYNADDAAVETMIQEGGIGCISFDFNYRYLGSNKTAKMLFPELEKHAVDDVFGYKPEERRIRHYLDRFKENQENNTFMYTLHDKDGNHDNDRYYKANVSYIIDGKRKRGYIITFTDDTEDRKYIQLIDTFNEKLQSEVEEKTKHIVEMHDNLIMSLAMMVESRDNSTGGHIKRTSECIRILVDEILKEGKHKLSSEFCKNVIKAAPMHDLGKIAVDDAVLRKPGRFTDEEYAKMKLHAAEGARVIHDILLNTEDSSFKEIAENVAHYHHERWDGSGYPDALTGEQIPFEARIMAIADVYDALVSKRVYKEAFDFERADSIIMEGMGTQFDPGLKSVYEKARPRLEEYYKKVS